MRHALHPHRATALALAMALALAAGASAPAFADEPDLAATISGVVSAEAGGALLPGVHVELISPDGSTVADATTSVDGVYAIGGMTAESYFLRATVEPGSPYLASWWGGSSIEDAQSIVLSAGEETVVNVGLPLGGSVAGTVRSGGAPVGGATVEMLNDMGSVIRSTASSDLGTFEFVGLSTGAYDLTAAPPIGSTLLGALLDGLMVTAGMHYADTDLDLVAVPDPDFTNAPVPIISGTATVGQLLTAASGSWAPTPDTLTFQWLRDGGAIAGATSETYRVDAVDAGSVITVAVSANKVGFAPATRTSDATPAVAVGTLSGVTPAISGTATVGQTLAAAPGVWGPAPVTLAYQWKRDGAPIGSATASTYVLAPADGGKSITVSVTGTKPGYSALTTTSTATVPTSALTTAAPTISGTARVGSVLTAMPGSWGPTPVALTYQWKRGGAAIPGATAASYAVAAADAGTLLTVTVTGAKAGYATVQKTSAATALVTGGIIALAPVPVITGTARVGAVLTAGSGVWGPAPIALSYQWKRGGVAVAGGTGATYSPSNLDVGAVITVTVTGSRPGYSSVARTSAATVAITGGILTAPVPTLSGSPTVGSTVTALPGSWGPAPVSLSYQWKRGGAVISGATGSRYALVTADAGSTITVTVTGARAGFTTVSRVSAASPLITGALLTASPVPTISGTRAVGGVLTAGAGSWAPAPVVLTYQWKRAGATIAGATLPTYKLTIADVGSPITVTVTGTRSGYTSVTRVSAAVTLPRSFASAPVPVISGSAQVGAVLTAAPGGWSPAPAFTYQWTRNGTAIAGATSSSYRLVAADAGLPVRVIVTAAKAGYVTTSRTSAPVTAPRVFTTAPTPVIGGASVTRSVLTAVTGAWAPAPTSFSYQWMRGGVPIAGATSPTYTLLPGDVDSVVTVRVTAVRTGFAPLSLSSAGRAALGLAYPNCTALNVDYPAGVARAGTTADMVSGVAKSMPAGVRYSSSLYSLNTGRDGDNDGIACEKR